MATVTKRKPAPSDKTAAKPAAKSERMTYYFGATRTDGSGKQKALLGGKGANLAEMTSIGLPVPPGFTITTACCDLYYKNKQQLPAGLMDDVRKNIGVLEKELSKKFGDRSDPLLVSVRSGAAASMPGMMNTILNLGLNDVSVCGLANATGNERFAYDSYRRLINMFGDVVVGVDHEHFEHAFDKIKLKYKAKNDTDVPVEGMIALCDAYKEVYQRHYGKPFPQDPIAQLELSIEAVFRSWMQPRAVKYREVENISGLLGTAVNIQSMVFGNMGDDSGTGVAFTRNPSTGENKFLWRVPDQRPRRRRGGWHPHAAARRSNAEVEQEGASTALGNQEAARESFPRRAGHRIHDRAQQAVHAANSHGQAHRRRGRADRLRSGQGKVDRRSRPP